MAKSKQTQTIKGAPCERKLARRQQEITAGLDKLRQKFAKLHSRQKKLRQQGRDRRHENLAFARDLRKLQRKTDGLLGKLSELKADGRRMEQRIAADLLGADQVSARMAGYEGRLAGTDQRLEQLQGRSQELERLGRQMSGRADALERHVEVMQEELRSYAQAVGAQLTLPVRSTQAQEESPEEESPEVVNGSAGSEARPSDNGQSANVLAFRKAEQGAEGLDAGLLEDLGQRITGLERLCGGLDEKIQGFDQAVGNLEAGRRQLQSENESFRQWLEQQGEELFAGQDALRVQAARLDAELEALSQERDSDREALDRLGRDSTAGAERIARLEQQLATADQRAQGLAGRIEGLEITVRALTGDAEQRLEETHLLQNRVANLDSGLDEVRGAGSEVRKRLAKLDAADGRLADAQKELAEWTGGLVADTAALDKRQGRLRLGLGTLGLLLLGLALAGYWLFDNRIERQTRPFVQDLAELQQGLVAQEDRLDSQGAELHRISQGGLERASGVNRIDEMSGLVRGQGVLLTVQGRDLGLVQGEVEALRDAHADLLARAERIEQALQASQSRRGSLKSGSISPASAPPVLDGVLGPDWLAGQDPAHYTIQIVAAHDPRVIANTAGAHAYSADLAQYRRLGNGRDWYLLLHGNYPSLEEASAALDRLPAAIQAYGPWVRSFASVQRQLTRP